MTLVNKRGTVPIKRHFSHSITLHGNPPIAHLIRSLFMRLFVLFYSLLKRNKRRGKHARRTVYWPCPHGELRECLRAGHNNWAGERHDGGRLTDCAIRAQTAVPASKWPPLRLMAFYLPALQCFSRCVSCWAPVFLFFYEYLAFFVCVRSVCRLMTDAANAGNKRRHHVTLVLESPSYPFDAWFTSASLEIKTKSRKSE